MSTISQPAINRLCTLFQILVDMERQGIATVSSTVLGTQTGNGSANVRKDISCLESVGSSGSGYDVIKLKNAIAEKFGFEVHKAVCVVGLGRIGTAFINYAQNIKSEFRIVAGFDSSTNKIETIKTSVSVFPAYQITEIAKKMNIELGILAVPESAAEEAALRLVDGGVRGIINFTDAHLTINKENVFVKNIDITSELRVLSALIKIQSI